MKIRDLKTKLCQKGRKSEKFVKILLLLKIGSNIQNFPGYHEKLGFFTLKLN